MPWQDEYVAALQERDNWEQADAKLYQQYTKLADRTAALQNATSDLERSPMGVSVPHAPTPSTQKKDIKDAKSTTPGLVSGEGATAIRRDLIDAQRSRSLLETKLQTVTEELQKLKMQSSLDRNRIKELTREKTSLTTSVRDRDEELKGKRKLLEDMHDEAVSMTLQLNMADEQSDKLRKENKDLVDRWMKKMAQEADAMNEKSEFS